MSLVVITLLALPLILMFFISKKKDVVSVNLSVPWTPKDVLIFLSVNAFLKLVISLLYKYGEFENKLFLGVFSIAYLLILIFTLSLILKSKSSSLSFFNFHTGKRNANLFIGLLVLGN